MVRDILGDHSLEYITTEATSGRMQGPVSALQRGGRGEDWQSTDLFHRAAVQWSFAPQPTPQQQSNPPPPAGAGGGGGGGHITLPPADTDQTEFVKGVPDALLRVFVPMFKDMGELVVLLKLLYIDVGPESMAKVGIPGMPFSHDAPPLPRCFARGVAERQPVIALIISPAPINTTAG